MASYFLLSSFVADDLFAEDEDGVPIPTDIPKVTGLISELMGQPVTLSEETVIPSGQTIEVTTHNGRDFMLASYRATFASGDSELVVLTL